MTFLNVLRKGKESGVNNAIFDDFLMHLESIESAVKQFSAKKLADWEDNDWQGFYLVLHETVGEEDSKADWGYVANPSGGFFGFWWHFAVSPQGDYWSYLQWEKDRLCYKIGFPPEVFGVEGWKSKADEIRTRWSKTLLNLDSELSDKNTKTGKTMTVAKVDDALCKADGKLDAELTISKMGEAQEVLKQARELIHSSVKSTMEN